MNAQEAATLCRAVKSVCPAQKFDEFTPDFWHPLLEDIPFEEAKRAVIEVAKKQPWIAPAEIRTEVFAHRRLRAKMVPDVIPPRELADLPEDGWEWTKVWQDAVIAGHTEDRSREIANRQFGIDEDLTLLAIEAGEQVSMVANLARQLAASKPAPAKRAPVQRYPAQWAGDKGITVLDPDGWRNARKDFRSLCTEAEFDAMAAESTVGPFERMTTPIPTTEEKAS